MVTAFGETKCVTEWGEDARCKAAARTVEQRVVALGWDHERAVITPSMRPSKNLAPSG